MARGEIKALQFSDGVEVTAASSAPIGESYELADASGWDGTVTTLTYDVTQEDDNGNTVSNARSMVWQLKAAGDNYKVVEGVTVDHPSATQVRFTVGSGYPIASGTYLLVGR